MLILAISGLCCLLGLAVLVVAILILAQQAKAAPAEANETAGETAPPSQPRALDADGMPEAGGPVESARPRDASDGPAAGLANPGAALPGPAGALPSPDDLAYTRSKLPTEAVRRPPDDPSMAATENIFLPARPPVPGPPSPSSLPRVPAPDTPPPLPQSHRDAVPPPPVSSASLDPARGSQAASLRPGATIIPPDDWNDGYADDDDIDETMLMVRPPLPPKK